MSWNYVISDQEYQIRRLCNSDLIRTIYENISSEAFNYDLQTLDSLPLIKVKDTFVSFPFSKTNFEELKDYYQDSPFGYYEKTIIDHKVRKAFEIDAKNIELLDWVLSKSDSSYDNPILEQIRQNLAPYSEELSSELYKMNVYTKGDHFQVHKDTQRSYNNIGTLLVSLPSFYEGGEFVLYEDGNKRTFDFSKKGMKCSLLSFYGDLNHEVKEILKGYRITLAFNLFISTNYNRTNRSESLVRIFRGLKTFPVFKDFKYIQFGILLKHSYSQESLREELLKGRDFTLYQTFKNDYTIDLVPFEIKEDMGIWGEVKLRKTIIVNGEENEEEDQENEDIYPINLGNLIILFHRGYAEHSGGGSLRPVFGNGGTEASLWYKSSLMIITPKKVIIDYLFNFTTNVEFHFQ